LICSTGLTAPPGLYRPFMTDGEDVRTRVEDALRRAASTAYEAAHGTLEERAEADVATRWRFRVSPRAAVTATIVVGVIGAMIVFLPPTVARVPPDGEAASVLSNVESTSSNASPTTSSASTVALPTRSVVVHVAGAVFAPGLYKLDGGARVADAVAAAGGAAEGADLDALNLARVVVDGEQVRVPSIGEAAVGGPVVGEVASAGGRVNINTADALALERLPGVGPVLAARITAYRDSHGPFASVDALDDVSGVGPAVLEKVRAAATV
jgi:competence protein ComEA